MVATVSSKNSFAAFSLGGASFGSIPPGSWRKSPLFLLFARKSALRLVLRTRTNTPEPSSLKSIILKCRKQT